MNYHEIKEKYTEELKELEEKCIRKIDRTMIRKFKAIEATGLIIIDEGTITSNGYLIDTDYKEDLINRMKKHYERDWEITYKKKPHQFAFRLKHKHTSASVSRNKISRSKLIEIED